MALQLKCTQFPNLSGYRVSVYRRVLMDEARTLSLLAWVVGGIVGVLFVLEAIALSLN